MLWIERLSSQSVTFSTASMPTSDPLPPNTPTPFTCTSDCGCHFARSPLYINTSSVLFLDAESNGSGQKLTSNQKNSSGTFVYSSHRRLTLFIFSVFSSSLYFSASSLFMCQVVTCVNYYYHLTSLFWSVADVSFYSFHIFATHAANAASRKRTELLHMLHVQPKNENALKTIKKRHTSYIEGFNEYF